MQGKIALEEHFAIDDTLMRFARGILAEMFGKKLSHRVLDHAGHGVYV